MFESVEIQEYKSETGNWNVLLIDGKQAAMSRVDDISSTSVYAIMKLMKRAYDTGWSMFPVRGL